GMHADVISVGIHPIDPVAIYEYLASALFDEKALQRRPRLPGGAAVAAAKTNLLFGALERALEALRAHGLQQIVQRFCVKGTKRMVLMRRQEHHVEISRLRYRGEHREAIHVRELHIQKEQVWP